MLKLLTDLTGITIALYAGLRALKCMNVFYKIFFIQLVTYAIIYILSEVVQNVPNSLTVKHDNSWLYNLYLPVETAFLSWAAFQYFKHRKEKFLIWMHVAADDEALDLVEHRRVRLVAVHAVDAARRDDADGRLLLQHGADLHRRGVRAQEQAFAVPVRLEEEGVVCLARRMSDGEVEAREIVVVRLDIRPLGDPETPYGSRSPSALPRRG